MKQFKQQRIKTQECSIIVHHSDYDDPGETIVTCLKSGISSEAYGDHELSKKYALRELTQICSCDASFHFVPDKFDNELEQD